MKMYIKNCFRDFRFKIEVIISQFLKLIRFMRQIFIIIY
jgi:hypothetical protein